MSKRTEYIDSIEKKLREWDKELEKLEEKKNQAGAKAKAEYQEQIRKLRERRKETGQRLKKLQQAGDEAWTELKEGLEKSVNVFSSAIKDARNKFS
ncbi:MAG: hypothetical protein P8Y60_17520 [Calditrichota bacterium]